MHVVGSTDTSFDFEECSITMNSKKVRNSIHKNKKRKRKQDSESDSKTQTEIDSSRNNQELSSKNEALATDALPVSNANSDQSSVLSPKRKKRKKNQNQISVANLMLPSSERGENSGEETSLKLLKPSLKKKKRKNRKKTIDQTKLKGDGSDAKINQKNSLKKSVTFDETVKVELIESGQATPDEAAQQSCSRKKEKALAYLKKWEDDKDNWRFEKLTQMWLLKNMYQEIMVRMTTLFCFEFVSRIVLSSQSTFQVPAETFAILLKYLVNLKGASRDLVVDLSEKIIAKVEQKTSEENDPELQTAYNRARSVLQFIQ